MALRIAYGLMKIIGKMISKRLDTYACDQQMNLPLIGLAQTITQRPPRSKTAGMQNYNFGQKIPVAEVGNPPFCELHACLVLNAQTI